MRPLVDLLDAAALADGYLVAQCIGPDGEPWPWLIAPLCSDCEDAATHGSRNDVPAHERTGRLPRDIRDALGLVHRCGAPTWHGQPCRNVVTEADLRCGLHVTGSGGGS